MSIKKLLTEKKEVKDAVVRGWVRTKRGNSKIKFVSLNDGSTINNIQIVIDLDDFEDVLVKKITTGSCILVRGNIVFSEGKGQDIEMDAQSIKILGEADPEKYPLQPKKHSLEFLRDIAHLRFRTNTFGAVFRVRHALTFAIHKFFNDQGFYNLHTPIITGADAEGAGEMFRVTTLENSSNFEEDFFKKKTHLTVSGQLEAELGALALGKVYTFGPTFRAENSNTSRHLSEFWMIEPEMAFFDLEKNVTLAESFLKYCIGYCVENCKEDLRFLDERFSKENEKLKKEDRSDFGLLERLDLVIKNNFEKLKYTEAIDILKKSKPNKKKRFKFLISGFGDELQSEHERYLVEKLFKKPVIITDYPKKIKAFYMKLNEDNETVKAMDVLFPSIGEIIGGSQREDSLNILKKRMSEKGVCEKELWWYLETRKYGTCPHSGFGLGFERLVMFVTGMKNIRDVIPFPRTPQNAEF